MQRIVLALAALLFSASGCSRSAVERDSFSTGPANPNAEQAELLPATKTLEVNRRSSASGQADTPPTEHRHTPASSDKGVPPSNDPKKQPDPHSGHGAGQEERK